MTSTTITSSYTRLSPWQARAVLIASMLLIGFGLWKSPTPPPLCNVREENAKSGDVFLYMTEIKRIHAGENYYHAAAEELVAQGYPTASVFNWRTPLPMLLIGKLPDPIMGRLILIAAGIAMLLMAFEAAAREQPNVYRLAMPLTVLLIAPLLPCFQGNVFVLTEVWAGIMMALSLCAYGVNLRFLGATMALAALFLRELALPYCLLGLALALWQRRPKESIVYIIGLIGWGVFYGLHYWKVSHLITAAAEAHRQGWVRFGGLTFVIAVTQMNACLVLLPVWVTVIFFALSMIGFAGWQSAWGMRIALTACMYIVAFAIVGQEFNRYWGLMITPLFCFGAVRAPAALRDLWHAAKLTLPQKLTESLRRQVTQS
ncbi:MAG: hypothetical protein ACLP9L_40560 [Thermoguttaceae bacterium]